MKPTRFKHKPARRVKRQGRPSFFRLGLARKPDYRPDQDLPAWRSLLRLGLLGLIVAGFIYLSMVSINILILGTDDVDYSKHTDTIMLVQWKPLPRRLALLSVPRDTLIHLPKRGAMKINAVYAYGTAVGSPAYALAMTRATVENLLNLKVNYTVHIKYTSFIKLVDALGGVPLYVPKRMVYTDQAGGVDINLAPGYQLLDGRQALNYARFRHDQEGDIGRIRRQQNFVKAFLTQIARFSKLPQTVGAFVTFLKEVETNMSPGAAIFLAWEIKSVAGSSWRQAIVPGKGIYIKGISYWQTDPEKVKKVVADLGKPPHKHALKIAVTPSRTLAAAASPKPASEPSPEPTPIRIRLALPAGPQPVVRVLNGCGVSGVAGQLAKRLQDEKIVIRKADITNAPAFDYPLTIVKSKPQNMEWARKVAQVLGLTEDRIQVIPKSITYPSVTVVIGDDYRELLR